MEQPWGGRAAHAGDAAQQHCPATARDGAELQCHCKHPAQHSWKSDEDALMAPRSPRAQCGSRQVRKAGITSDERHGGLMMNVANLTHVRSANHREAAAAEHINTKHLIPFPPLANKGLQLELHFHKDFTHLVETALVRGSSPTALEEEFSGLDILPDIFSYLLLCRISLSSFSALGRFPSQPLVK